MNRNRKKAAAATLAAGMAVVLGAGTVMAAASTGDNGLQKEETVYVNTTAGGEVTDVTVSDWLKNSGDSSNSEVKDASDLQDIKNVKGDETFTQNGNDLTWSTDGKDIYYQGKTEKNLPVSVEIKYYMDGTEVSPEALAGKTGHLKMEVTYTNTSKTTKTVNGKKTDIYSPFVMVTGMILSTDNFSNITVDNGKVISDGSRNVVVGFGMPGMKESLDMSSDIADEVNIPEGFTVEADVTDCEMNSTFTVALTDIFKDIDLNDELKDSMKDLTDAAVKLVDGTKDLYDGTNKLNDKYKEFYDGIGTLKSGVSDLNDGAKELNKGQKKFYKEGIKKLDDTVNGDLKDILDRFEVIQSDDVMYTTFTDRSGDMDGNVKFIFESDPIEISDDEK
jgi:putative membrane protein